MAVEPRFLLVSNRRDLSLDWVVRELRLRGLGFVRLNTELLAEHAWIVRDRDWSIQIRSTHVSLGSVRSILYRRPEPPRLPGLARPDASLARGQWHALLGGLRSLESVRWISDPAAIEQAENKLCQLKMAKEIGFAVPDTLITNSRDEALRAARAWGGHAIVKALDAPLVKRSKGTAFVFSTLVSETALQEMMPVELAPMLVQEPIVDKTDIRVTVIGTRVLAAATRASTTDWRLDPFAVFAPTNLDEATTRLCIDLVQALGLRFGGIDLVKSDDGRLSFLEINPNGEWGWLQARGLPIAQALVDELQFLAAER